MDEKSSRCSEEPAYLEIGFEEGVPRLLGGKYYSLLSLVEELNRVGGENGFGRVDHVENRLVGIKSREIYECPAAFILLEAYRDLQNLVLPREVIHFKPHLEEEYAQLVYEGLWYSTSPGSPGCLYEVFFAPDDRRGES